MNTGNNDGLNNLGDQLDAAISKAHLPASPAPTTPKLPPNVHLGNFSSTPAPASGTPPTEKRTEPTIPTTQFVRSNSPAPRSDLAKNKFMTFLQVHMAWFVSAVAVLACYGTVFLYNLATPFQMTEDTVHQGNIFRRMGVSAAETFKGKQYSTRFDWLGRKYVVVTIGDRTYVQSQSGKPAVEVSPKTDSK